MDVEPTTLYQEYFESIGNLASEVQSYLTEVLHKDIEIQRACFEIEGSDPDMAKFAKSEWLYGPAADPDNDPDAAIEIYPEIEQDDGLVWIYGPWMSDSYTDSYVTTEAYAEHEQYDNEITGLELFHSSQAPDVDATTETGIKGEQHGCGIVDLKLHCHLPKPDSEATREIRDKVEQHNGDIAGLESLQDLRKLNPEITTEVSVLGLLYSSRAPALDSVTQNFTEVKQYGDEHTELERLHDLRTRDPDAYADMEADLAMRTIIRERFMHAERLADERIEWTEKAERLLSGHIKHLDEQLVRIEQSTAIEDDVAVIDSFGTPSGRGAERHAGDANRKRKQSGPVLSSSKLLRIKRQRHTRRSSTPIPDLVTSPSAPDDEFVDVVRVQSKEFKEAKEPEKLYCVCRQPSNGPMIFCEGEGCKYGWFHYDCVGITEGNEPEGDWICWKCMAGHRRREKGMKRNGKSNDS